MLRKNSNKDLQMNSHKPKQLIRIWYALLAVNETVIVDTM